MARDRIFLGSEVVVMSVDDARRLVVNLRKIHAVQELQRMGILDILIALQSAVKRHDESEEVPER
jgi:hypothetical protein